MIWLAPVAWASSQPADTLDLDTQRLIALGYDPDEAFTASRDPTSYRDSLRARKLRLKGYLHHEVQRILRFPGHMGELEKRNAYRLQGYTDEQISLEVGTSIRLTKKQAELYEAVADSLNIYNPFIQAAAEREKLNPLLIKSVIIAESNGNPRAVSFADARGLMQLIPRTGAAYGLEDFFDPSQNIRAGSAYLRDLMDYYGQDLDLSLAAYNAGPKAVDTHRGIPKYPETRKYVAKVKAIFYHLKRP